MLHRVGGALLGVVALAGCGLTLTLQPESEDGGTPPRDAYGTADSPLRDGRLPIDGNGIADGATPVPGCGSTSALVDEFDGARSLWWFYPDDLPLPYVTGGQLHVPLVAFGPGGVGSFSKAAYRFRADRVAVRVASIPAASAPATAFMALWADDSRMLTIGTSGGQLVTALSDGGATVLRMIPWSPTEHRWWQMREQGGEVLWETRADGGRWTVQRREPTPDFVDVVNVMLGVEATVEPAPDTEAVFEHFNADVMRPFVPYCPAESLVDDFGDERLDAVWATWDPADPRCSFVETRGQIRVEAAAGGLWPVACSLVTRPYYDLAEGQVTVHLTSRDVSTPQTITELWVRDLDDNAAGGSAAAWELYVWNDRGAVGPHPTTAPDLWWRLAGRGSDLVFEVSDTGVGFTEAGRLSPAGVDLSAVQVFFGLADDGTGVERTAWAAMTGYNTP